MASEFTVHSRQKERASQVVEHLPSESKALSSNPSTTKKIKRTKKGGKAERTKEAWVCTPSPYLCTSSREFQRV
jgi:hypothetical protein